MLSALANIARLLRIARTLAQHDALFPLERLGVASGIVTLVRLVSRRSAPGRPGERLAAAFEALGPAFIKLGQALSVRSDVVGEDVADDLSGAAVGATLTSVFLLPVLGLPGAMGALSILNAGALTALAVSIVALKRRAPR